MPDTATPTLSQELTERLGTMGRAHRQFDAAKASLIEEADKLRHQRVSAVLKDQTYSGNAATHVFSRDPSREDDSWRDLRGGYMVWDRDTPLVGVVKEYEITTYDKLLLFIIVDGKKDVYRISTEHYELEILEPPQVFS